MNDVERPRMVNRNTRKWHVLSVMVLEESCVLRVAARKNVMNVAVQAKLHVKDVKEVDIIRHLDAVYLNIQNTNTYS